jgi:hypothetical protein
VLILGGFFALTVGALALRGLTTLDGGHQIEGFNDIRDAITQTGALTLGLVRRRRAGPGQRGSRPPGRMDLVTETFIAATWRLTEDEFQSLYGPWESFGPGQIAGLLDGVRARWHIAGGRAARAGAAPRHHEDTDVVVLADDIAAVREAMASWHLWENTGGTLRPVLPGIELNPACHQLWVRRDASQPWRFEFLIDRVSTDQEWVFNRDDRVRVPWPAALHEVDGLTYLRPEIVLLYKARLDRPKDRQPASPLRPGTG